MSSQVVPTSGTSGYRQIDSESVSGRQFWQRVVPSARLETEVTVGRELVGRNPREWVRGAGPRHIDLASPTEVTDPGQDIIAVEVKRHVTPQRLDEAFASLLFERELLRHIRNIPQNNIRPIMVFSGASFDVRDPPETIDIYANLADRMGVEWWIGVDGAGFHRVLPDNPV